MHTLLLRYTFSDPSPVLSAELLSVLKNTYGGAVQFIADGTVLIDTADSPDGLYERLAHLFTFDDKLFVCEAKDIRSQHRISGIRKIAG